MQPLTLYQPLYHGRKLLRNEGSTVPLYCRSEYSPPHRHQSYISARSLKIKRNVISRLLEEGLYPYTKRYLGKFDNHFSTIGLIGMNEAGLNAKWLRADLSHRETQQFAKEVLNHMRERLSDYQEQYGDLYNLEATPAESTTYRLAKHDKEKYSDIITAGYEGDKPYYTNSSHLPVDYTTDIFDALDIQGGRDAGAVHAPPQLIQPRHLPDLL